MSPSAPVRVRRHGPAARVAHLSHLVLVAVLLLTGWALAEVLPPMVVRGLGGHARVSGLHDVLGLSYAALAMGGLVVGCRPVVAWLAPLCRVRRADVAWLVAFARDPLARREPAPWHGDRLDPLQRWVLALIVAALGVVVASGLCLYFAPANWRWVFVVAVRAHIWANDVLVLALAAHVLAGLGLLPTHRGLLQSMFGDGAVPLATARRLWPGWTAAHEEVARTPGPRCER